MIGNFILLSVVIFMLLGVDIAIMLLCHIFPRLNGRVLARTVQRNDLCIAVRISEESDRSTGNSAFFFVFRDHNSVGLSACRDDEQLKLSLLQRILKGDFKGSGDDGGDQLWCWR